jgi:predicted nucleic acid-binding Zn ribbon protein
MTEPNQEAKAVYARFRQIFGDSSNFVSRDARKRATVVPGSTVPFGGGRDAVGLGDVIDSLTSKMGWSSPLAQSELLASWAAIVGEETAEKSQPMAIDEGVLLVRCDSTAWAQQLRNMRSHVMTQIALRYPDAGIVSVEFKGPNAPSWKRGPRAIPGRGPRDTYG